MRINYVLIDYENVTPENLDLLDQEWIRVLLFVGKNQTKIPFSIVKAMQKMAARAQYIEMSGIGHNALDFHIAYYIGRISAKDLENVAFFHIVSNDAGFDPLIEHLKKQEHVFADRVTKIEDIPALIQSTVISKSFTEQIDFVKNRLLKPNAPRPRSRKTLSSHIAALFMKKLSEQDVSNLVEALFKDNSIKEKSNRLVYSDENG